MNRIAARAGAGLCAVFAAAMIPAAAWATSSAGAGAAPGAAPGAAASAGSGATATIAEDTPGWIATAAAGFAGGPNSLPVRVGLGGAVPITLPGTARFDRGNGASFSLARQFEGLRWDEGRRHLPMRLELEGLRVWWPRKGITAGVASATLSDSLSIDGGFLNGLVRVRRDDSARWWLGAGVGRVQMDLPDASAALPGCGCLRAGQAEGTVWRAKARVELITGADSALVLETAYSKLPALQGGSRPGTVTDYPAFGLRSWMMGWRLAF